LVTVQANPNADPVIPINGIGLKDGLMVMFKLDINQLDATEAVMDLVMKSNKTINVFYVRVKWAMEVKKPLYPPGPVHCWSGPGPFHFFPGGTASKIQGVCHVRRKNPTNLTTLRKRCSPIEAIQSQTKRKAALSTEVEEENSKVADEFPIELLTKEIAAFKAKMKCFNCNNKGHLP
jgi:hypothetical protein